jgi:hypothetical protein
MTTFAPRPLRAGETPEPGDLFFQRGHQAISVLIRLATGSDVNHTGVILANLGANKYEVAEANAPGFEVAPKDGFTGYVVRISDDVVDRLALAHAAQQFTLAEQKYDYLAILRFLFIVLGRWRPSSLSGKLLLGVPTFVVRAAARLVLLVMPNERPNRVICSGSVRFLLRDTFGAGDWSAELPDRDDETSPADLLSSLLGRRRW